MWKKIFFCFQFLTNLLAILRINESVTFRFPAGEFRFWICITALWPKPLPPPLSIQPDLSSSGGWILILGRLAWMNPVLLMYHKSATVWCHPGFFFSPGDGVISISVVMVMWRGGRKMRALTSGFRWLQGQTVHLGRAGNSTLAVCLCADNSGPWKRWNRDIVTLCQTQCSLPEAIQGGCLPQYGRCRIIKSTLLKSSTFNHNKEIRAHRRAEGGSLYFHTAQWKETISRKLMQFLNLRGLPSNTPVRCTWRTPGAQKQKTNKQKKRVVFI